MTKSQIPTVLYLDLGFGIWGLGFGVLDLPAVPDPFDFFADETLGDFRHDVRDNLAHQVWREARSNPPRELVHELVSDYGLGRPSGQPHWSRARFSLFDGQQSGERVGDEVSCTGRRSTLRPRGGLRHLWCTRRTNVRRLDRRRGDGAQRKID